MDCPACTNKMTQLQPRIRHMYAADIRHELWRCEKCKVTAEVEIMFSVDEPAPAVSPEPRG